MTKGAVNENQLVLRCQAELAPETQYLELDPEKRIGIARFMPIASSVVHHGLEPDPEAYEAAEKASIIRNIYIPPTDARFDTAHQLVRIGVPFRSTQTLSSHYGVVFPSTEFQAVARSPKDLGRHVINITQRARLAQGDRDEAISTAMRSAGHALQSKIHSQSRLLEQYEEELAQLRQFYGDFIRPRTSRKAKNIEKNRAFCDEKIHEMAELSGINSDLTSIAVTGMHRALRRNLYSGNFSRAQFAGNWKTYLAMVGFYHHAKGYKIKVSREICERELADKYQIYLDVERAKQAEATALSQAA